MRVRTARQGAALELEVRAGCWLLSTSTSYQPAISINGSNVTSALGDSPLVARVNSPPVRGCVGSCVAG